MNNLEHKGEPWRTLQGGEVDDLEPDIATVC